MCHGRHGAESRILFVTVSLVIAKILLFFLFGRMFSHFLDLLFHFHPLLYAKPCEIVHCFLKLRTLSPVKNLRGDILKHRTRMKDEALEEGDFLVSAVQVLSLA